MVIPIKNYPLWLRGDRKYKAFARINLFVHRTTDALAFQGLDRIVGFQLGTIGLKTVFSFGLLDFGFSFGYLDFSVLVFLG